jgi:hypothetical protein
VFPLVVRTLLRSLEKQSGGCPRGLKSRMDIPLPNLIRAYYSYIFANECICL